MAYMRACENQLACTTDHKLACCMSFIRAVYHGDLPKARVLQKRCRELQSLEVDAQLILSPPFAKLLDKVKEMMQLSIKERADELRQARTSLPQDKIDHEKKSIASLLRSMLPAGGCDLPALQQQDGGIVTDPLEMANEINSFWQQTFNNKETDAKL